MSRRITVTVRRDGSIAATSSGVPGPSRLADLPVITELCACGQVVDSRLTPEYTRVASAQETQHVVIQERA